MNKPTFKEICLMYIQQLTNFPYIEKDFDALTDYGLLCKIVDKLNEVITNTNEQDGYIVSLYNAFIELKTYVENFFDNLDVQDEINNKLDEMVEDGTFDSIIKRVLPQTGTLYMNLVHRDSSEFVKNITTESAESPVKGYIQGMTTTPTSILYSVVPGGSYSNKSDYAYLIEVSKATNQVIRERFLNIYHGNCLAYNDEDKEVYVACVSKTNQEGTGQVAINQILVLDYRTLETTQVITPPQEVLDSGDHIMSVSYDNKNHVLGIGGLYHFWILSDWETVEKTITLDLSNTAPMVNPFRSNATSQQMIILFDNKLYQCRYLANGINVYDLDGNLLNNYYNFKTNVPIPIQEFESIAIEEDGTLYISSCQDSYLLNTNYRVYDNTIFKTNIIYGGYHETLIDDYNLWNPNYNITYHVNPLTTNKLQIGTATYPFKYMQQALNSAILLKAGINIVCDSVANYGVIILNSNKNINIIGNFKATFYGMQCLHQSNLAIGQVTFDLSNKIELDDGYKNIRLEYSDVELTNVTFIGGSDNEYAINSFHNKLKVLSSQFTDFTNAIYNRNVCETTLNDITFTRCTYYFYFTALNVINYPSEYVYMKSNPDGVLPKFTNYPQMLQYTKTDNHIVFNQSDIASTIATIQPLFLNVSVLANNVWHGLTIPLRYANIYSSQEFIENNKLYRVLFKFTKTSEGFDEEHHVYEINPSTGAYTDVTATATVEFYSLNIINP